ncbi:helix-turn-helix domain-containing protein [Mucilaginibacter kameinonensis]|uniref:helix-turn-helix domain-containing protein n=1 Tax=Mucilaginibacter kameinonensis TaxID=452286 RepID=UPI000EF7B837|nr:helix-turn-helix transcriptional regulator [Mucilaginibacter kameinonensis]
MKSNIENKLLLVAAKIRTERKRLGYSQEYVALSLDLSQNAYSKIELGYTNISLVRLMEIALILNTEIDYLLRV